MLLLQLRLFCQRLGDSLCSAGREQATAIPTRRAPAWLTTDLHCERVVVRGENLLCRVRLTGDVQKRKESFLNLHGEDYKGQYEFK